MDSARSCMLSRRFSESFMGLVFLQLWKENEAKEYLQAIKNELLPLIDGQDIAGSSIPEHAADDESHILHILICFLKAL